MAYFAKANIGIPPFGVVTFGEMLKDEHIQALGSERVAELVKEKALGVQNDACPAPVPIHAEDHPEETMTADEAEQTDDAEEPEEEADETEEEGDELNLPMDELVNDAPEDTGETPKKKGRKKKNEDQDA